MNLTYNPEISVEFHFTEIDTFPFPEELIRKWILAIIRNENKEPGDLNFIFCSDQYLHQMNVDYLDHDTLTDVITFDYSQDFLNISGDVFISIDRVKDNCKDLQLDFLNELCRIIAHGLLHIIGYDDKQPLSKDVMTSKEDHYLSLADFL
ncbi:MAG: rRNA maturation RNase YbeY [Bacteroidales bacterium]